MKHIFTFLFLSVISFSSLAQLTVDAGPVRAFCEDDLKNQLNLLAEDPIVSGGTAPYTYSWSTTISLSPTLVFHASSFLSDTTLANPILKESYGNSLSFELKITDSEGNTATDSLIVKFSSFMILTVEVRDHISLGDTLTLRDVISGGIPPLKFAWSPNYNIADTTVRHPKASPRVDTNYGLVITDSVGCKVYGTHRVFVTTNSTTNPSNSEFLSKVVPNPVSDQSIIHFSNATNSEVLIRVIDAMGNLVLEESVIGEQYSLVSKIRHKGSYIYTISNESGLITQGKFVK
jgi:hypothetical protein